MQAFRNDEEFKRQVVVALDRDLSAGVIERGETGWRNGRGSLVASLVHSGDLAVAEARLGIPVDVLAMLDHVCGHVYFGGLLAAEVAVRFFTACKVGADLSSVVPRLLDRLAQETPIAAAPEEERECARLRALFAVPGPAADSAVTVVDQWLDVCCRADVWRSGWSDAQEEEAQAALQELWNASRDLRRTGEWPDYPKMFRASHPELAIGYERALEVLVSSHDRRSRQVVDWFVEEVTAAGASL